VPLMSLQKPPNQPNDPSLVSSQIQAILLLGNYVSVQETKRRLLFDAIVLPTEIKIFKNTARVLTSCVLNLSTGHKYIV
jgi:hypothetical protein